MPDWDHLNRRNQADIENRILHGLSSEWDSASWEIQADIRKKLKKPLFVLRDYSRKLGYWAFENQEIGMNRQFALTHSWNDIREVLFHEMAHQLATQGMGARHEPPHGVTFQKACRILRANPQPTGQYIPLSRQIMDGQTDETDKTRMRIQKLLALAESSNVHEAESAMMKAHELIAKVEMEHVSQNSQRDYYSLFLGQPALRHLREAYSLAHLLRDFYFVRCIWISAYVLEKGKMGRVLEISGTARNLQIASYVYEFIKRFIDFEWSEYSRDKKLTLHRKSDFAYGILAGFRARLEKKPDSTGHTKSRSGSLVPIEDRQLKQYISVRYPHLRSFSRGGGSCNPGVLSDGKNVGKRLVIHQGITSSTSDGGIRYLTEK
ncbi:MAG: DUF2786 domain-containing protein [Desulfatirhabdiaceae bacterium]